MTKALLAATLILFAVMFASVAFATNPAPVVVKPLVVIPPVAPPVVAPPVAPTASTVAPVATPEAAAAKGPGVVGWAVVGGVAIYFYFVICEREKHVNPEGWFAKNCVIPFRD